MWEEGLECGTPAPDASSAPGSPRKLLSLAHIAACADWERLALVLLAEDNGTPWLLRPLVNAASMVNGACCLACHGSTHETP